MVSQCRVDVAHFLPQAGSLRTVQRRVGGEELLLQFRQPLLNHIALGFRRLFHDQRRRRIGGRERLPGVDLFRRRRRRWTVFPGLRGRARRRLGFFLARAAVLLAHERLKLKLLGVDPRRQRDPLAVEDVIDPVGQRAKRGFRQTLGREGAVSVREEPSHAAVARRQELGHGTASQRRVDPPSARNEQIGQL